MVAVAVSSMCPVRPSTTAEIVSVSSGYTRSPSVSPRQVQLMPPLMGVVVTVLDGPGARAMRAMLSPSCAP